MLPEAAFSLVGKKSSVLREYALRGCFLCVGVVGALLEDEKLAKKLLLALLFWVMATVLTLLLLLLPLLLGRF